MQDEGELELYGGSRFRVGVLEVLADLPDDLPKNQVSGRNYRLNLLGRSGES